MDTCPICFEDLSGKVKASPNACDHVFCLPCIEKWAKLGSFCPVDRKRFRKIVNLDSEDFIQVKPKKRKRRKTVYDFTTKCEVCFKSSNANVLLLCDCCDLGYHMFCLKPTLKTVPAGLWFCPTCVSVESKLKKNKGISKENEADLGNAVLQLEKIKKCVNETINTQDRRENDEEVNKEIDVNEFSDTRTVNNEECSLRAAEPCSKVASEFQGLNIEINCSHDIATSSSRGTNQRDTETKNNSKCIINANSKNEKDYIKGSPVQNEIHKNSELLYSNDVCLSKTQKDDSVLDDHLSNSKNEKDYIKGSPVQNEIHKNSELLYSNDVCLSKTEKDDSLLDDHLSQCDLYGDIKLAIVEENVIQSMLDKSYANMKNVHSSPCKSLHKVRFRKKIPEISPTSLPYSSKTICNENISQKSSSSFYNFSEDCMQENDGYGDASNINMSSPCSSTSADSNKGTFKHFISDVSIENCTEELSNQIFKSKTSKAHKKVREIQFSVFEQKEGSDVSQKKYSELSSKVCFSFSSNLNVSHCIHCKDMILATSQNCCKICKLKHMKSSTSSKCLQMSEKFELKCVATVSNKFLGLNYKCNTMGKEMSASDRRQYSLARKLQKIRKAQKKLTDTQN